MKNISQILNVLLAAALVILAIKITLLDNGKNQVETKVETADALDVIMTRASVRSYTDQAVENDKVEKMLKAAMAAPTARNQQPWAFIVVDSREILDELAETLPHAKMAAQAPLAIVACGDLTKSLSGVAQEYWVQDVSAAIENLLLAAHAMELGAVWTGVYPIPERVNDVVQVLSLPEHIIPLAVIPIGYPAGEVQPKDKWKPENIKYNKWS